MPALLAVGGLLLSGMTAEAAAVAPASASSTSAVSQATSLSRAVAVPSKRVKRHRHHHRKSHRTQRRALVTHRTATTLGAGIPLSNFMRSRNAFTLDVSRAPLNPRSRGMVANLNGQVRGAYGGVAAFNVWNYGIGFATATASTPRQRVIWDNCQRKGYTPSQLYSPSHGAMFVDVPIPSTAVPAAGTDSELTVWSPATDQMWEFWKAKKQRDGWHACWGGRIDHWSTSPGYFPDGTGASASGLAVSAGAVSVREARAGRINHAMSLAIPSLANWKTYSYPAQRSDGSDPFGAVNSIPTGTRFRLDPRLDVSRIGLTPVARAIAKAAQRYGFIVTDKSGAVAVSAESGAPMAATSGADPWRGILAGTASYAVMKNFPWNRLQALPFDYAKP